jgi:uncharacterized lipoprotein YehR (DUF1307 family)
VINYNYSKNLKGDFKMKMTVRFVAVALVVVMLGMALAACGTTLSGEYYFGDKTITKTYTTMEFSGSTVVVSAYVAGTKVTAESYEADYSIKDGEITMTWEVDGEEKSITQAFEELEDGSIKIGVITYKKAN